MIFDHVIGDPLCRDCKIVTSDPKDIMKNIGMDITRIKRKKYAEKKATMLQGMTDE